MTEREDDAPFELHAVAPAQRDVRLVRDEFQEYQRLTNGADEEARWQAFLRAWRRAESFALVCAADTLHVLARRRK